MSIIQEIESYDAARDAHVETLQARVRELEQENRKLLDLVVSGVRTRERAMFELIVSGALSKPAA